MHDASPPHDRLIKIILEAVESGADDAACADLEAWGVPAEHLGSLKSDDAATRLTAGYAVALWLQSKGDVVSALAINRVLACNAMKDPNCPPLMIANLLTSVCTEAVDTGNDAIVRRYANSWSASLERLGQQDAARQVHLCNLEATLNQGDFQSARDLLTQDDERGEVPKALKPIHERLRGKVDGILVKPDEKVPQLNSRLILRLTLEWLEAQTPGNPIIKQMETMLDDDARPELGPAFLLPPREIQEIVAAVERLKSSRSPLHALNAVHQAIGGVLLRPPADKNVYATLLPAARQAIEVADGLGLWEQGCSFRWLETVLLRRLDRLADALRQLQSLGVRIDRCRRKITDPRWRAGIAVYLQHLPWITADVACARGDGPAMLHAMEAAKARILGEIRPAQATIDNLQDPQAFLAAVRAGLAAAGRRTHLLAFLADTTADVQPGTVGTLALLLTHDGNLLSHRVKLAPAQIAAALEELQARVRGGVAPFYSNIDPDNPAARPFDDIITVLSPLVDWLTPLLGSALKKEDTLVISPDGPIHNVSFAMLTLAGEPLIEHFSIVCIPSATMLAAGSPMKRPSRALALLIPSASERVSPGNAYQREADDLSEVIDVEVVPDLDRLTAALEEEPGPVLVYVAAHGEVSTDTPLEGRGLGLSGDSSSWLTAERAGSLELVGAHVSVRACLVGISTEITSREALGFVWALLGAGCASMMAAVWAVDITSAQMFAKAFHRAWLTKETARLSRADAYRTACRELRAKGGAYAHPFHWAPFVLTTTSLAGDVV